MRPATLLLFAAGAFAQEGWSRIERFDTDGDGKVSRKEFKGPARAFERMDRNGDGFIDRSETIRGGSGGTPLSRADADRDGKVTREEWDTFFEKADVNGDEVLDAAETEAALRGEAPRDGAPKVGDTAPAVKATPLAGGEAIDLSKPKRTTVLVFGSYT